MTAARSRKPPAVPPCQVCAQRRRTAGQLCLICAIDQPNNPRESRKDTR